MKQETLELLSTIGFDITNATIYDAAEWFRKSHNINVEVTYAPNIEKFAVLTTDMNIKPKDATSEQLEKIFKDCLYSERFDEHPSALEFGLCKAVERYKQWR